ncbi:MAG: recombination-associated protein RdgC [Desulfurivibrio sp.]|nr:recombination-associated protein RdgC [Desulfurivibrio sp.]
MGLLARSASFVRYAVEGDLPENFWEFAAERIAAHSFRDIDETYDERSVGWVSVASMFDAEFSRAPYAVGDHLVMSMRIDERKVAAGILRKFCLKEEERLKTARQVPKLSRAQKGEIKENMQLMLLKKSLPAPAVYDLCWNLADNTILFFSGNQKAQESFEELFRQTFEVGVMLQVPYLVAEHLLPAEQRQALAEVEPAVFV